MANTHIVALALVAAMTAPALSLRQEFAWSELTARLERAALAGSGQELRAVRIDLLRQLVQPAEQAPARSLLEYAIAYVGYRLANQSDVPEQEQADLLDDAVERLEALVDDDPEYPEYTEARALLGSLYGLQIGRDASRGVVLLQPLVENAVKHGIQPHTRQGEVRVTAQRQGARVHVAVSDTGSGPNAPHATNGRGIDLTRRRLRATYGDNGAALSMAREESGGFTVRLDIPAEPERLRGFTSSADHAS